MPEGDTVHLAARRLHAALAGRPVVRSDFLLPALATADVAGATIREVVARGKHLLIRLGDDRTLHSHLRMDGAWKLFDPGEPWSGGPAHEIRVVLETPEKTAVAYRMHDVALVPTADEGSLVGHLGPDLLGPDWDAAEAVRRLAADPDASISAALLDQRNLAGIGNVYRCELLFLRGVAPWTRVGDVADLPAMVDLARRLLVANRDTGRQITTGNTRRGQEHWVYGRHRQQCRRCGTPIRLRRGVVLEERDTWWCPQCQPEPD